MESKGQKSSQSSRIKKFINKAKGKVLCKLRNKTQVWKFHFLALLQAQLAKGGKPILAVKTKIIIIGLKFKNQKYNSLKLAIPCHIRNISLLVIQLRKIQFKTSILIHKNNQLVSLRERNHTKQYNQIESLNS